MCFIKPYKVREIKGTKVILENGIKVYYDKKIGTLKPADKVLVFGNLIVEKLKGDGEEQDN